MELAPGIHNVITEPEMAPGVTNTYLLIGSEGAAWVDTGWNRQGEAEARLDYWRAMGSPRILGQVVTHRHPPHWGNCVAIREATGGPIICSPAERDAVEERMGAAVDREVEDGETLSLGGMTLQFVHSPGHTYGTLAVLIQESRALIPGDTIMGVGTSVVNPGDGEIRLFLQTMEKFRALDLSVIYSGQGPVITDANAKIDELVQHRHQREQQILRLLESGPKTVEQMFDDIYSGLNERLSNLARNQIRSHLIMLEQDGRVEGESYRMKTTTITGAPL